MEALRYLPAALGALILLSLVFLADPAKIYGYIVSSDKLYFALSVVLYCCGLVLRSYKWCIILNLFKQNVSWTKSIFYYSFTTLLGNVTPGRLGEPAIAHVIRKYENIRISSFLPLLFFDRLLDFVVIFLYALFSASIVASSFFDKISGNITAVTYALLLFFLLLCVFWLIATKSRFKKTFGDILSRAKEGFCKLLNSPRIFLPIFSLTLLAWLCEFGSMFAILKALGVDITYIQAVMVSSFGILIGLISMIPGGQGSAELSMVAITNQLLLPADKCIAAFVTQRVLNFAIVGVLVAPLYLIFSRKR